MKMRKLFLTLMTLATMAVSSMAMAAAPAPTEKVVLFYLVPDTILQAQNAEEDMVKGAEEFEKELKNHYSKRFIVQEVRRAPEQKMLAAGYNALIKPNQKPLIVAIELAGTGTDVDLYQNAFGAQAAGVSPTIKVHLLEGFVDKEDGQLYPFDYGIKAYGSGTFALGSSIYAAQTDPRKNVKNAVRGCFRDACKFNENINKYADPVAYQREMLRFTGKFKPIQQSLMEMRSAANEKIQKFETWCKADKTREPYLTAVNSIPTIEQRISFIDYLIAAGTYKEI